MRVCMCAMLPPLPQLPWHLHCTVSSCMLHPVCVSVCGGVYPAQGWVLRSGLLYGTDGVLYAAHPAAAHSTYATLVMDPRGTPVAAAPGCGSDGGLLGSACGGGDGGLLLVGEEEAVGRGGLGDSARPTWVDFQITSRVVGTVGGAEGHEGDMWGGSAGVAVHPPTRIHTHAV